MYAKGQDLLATYKTWHDKTKNSMQYVDPASFTKYYDEEKAKSVKRNETAAAEKKKKEEAAKKKAEDDKKKAEEEAKKKEKEEAELTLAEGDKKEPKKKEEPKDYFWAELDNLKNAGFAFDNHVQKSLRYLGANDGELSHYWIFFPQAIKEMEANGNYDGLDGYKSMANDNAKTEIAAYEAATKALVDARALVKKHLEETPGLKLFFKDKVEFKTVWLRGFAKFEGCPSEEQFADKLKANKNNQYTPYLTKAKEWMGSVKESDRLDFNKKFKNVLKLAGEWVAAGKTLDASLAELQKTMEKHHTGAEVQKCSKFVTEAAAQRVAMTKVYTALQTLNSKENKAQKEAQEYQEDVTKEGQANIAIWVILVLAILGTVGGVVYCKTQKKCCFAEKEEGVAEGGESDKAVFKKEVKSKNSHKKHTKESLMPTFKVAEEEA